VVAGHSSSQKGASSRRAGGAPRLIPGSARDTWTNSTYYSIQINYQILIERGTNAVVTTVTTTTYFANHWMIQRQVPLARAVSLMQHARAIIPPDAGLLEIHGPSEIILVPDQIIFSVDGAYIPRAPLVKKRDLWRRDNGECGYCLRPLSLAEATIDHVIPLIQNGQTVWDNVVTCCRNCNCRKGGRTPAEARMKLLKQLTVPKVRLRQTEN
jgi:hypothetical protein